MRIGPWFLQRTRENHANVDLNREDKSPQTTKVRAHVTWLQRLPNIDLIICVHEDWEAQVFYLNELNPENRPTLANTMIDTARATCLIDPDTVIDGRPVSELGIIRPISEPLLREIWPEAIYRRPFHCKLNYTIEAPSSHPLEQRITTHCAVLKAALAEFLRASRPAKPLERFSNRHEVNPFRPIPFQRGSERAIAWSQKHR